jgi:hypothetical protein
VAHAYSKFEQVEKDKVMTFHHNNFSAGVLEQEGEERYKVVSNQSIRIQGIRGRRG